ncbi:GFA family protein [Nitratireductor sp. GISD-1A_MAKvit]|uniref:GFA family protein n=1 Tax=Nitratireductor sp. GISD-1A_MAKvit TaxID=3234198 RepID=UPI003467D88B
MSRLVKGSCLCGAIRYQCRGTLEGFFLCHCSRCRKDTGSAHAANLFFTNAEVTWLSGRDHSRNYRVPGTRHEKSFCTECGGAVPCLQMEGSLVVVPAGSVDTPLDVRPDAHVCHSSRAGWDDDLNEVPKIDGLPG